MAQQSMARRHRAAHYDGTNGAAVRAEIPGSSPVSGGTGNTTLVFDIAGAGQVSVPPNRNIVWTEYPSTPVQVLDTALTDAELASVYGLLGDIPAMQAQIAAMQGVVGSLRVQRASGTTNASGLVTFTWPVAFSGSPAVALGIETATGDVHSARLTAVSATGATVHVLRAPVVTVLSINVLGATVNAAGATVHAVAVGPA